jgi:site-specific recombinase XerD
MRCNPSRPVLKTALGMGSSSKHRGAALGVALGTAYGTGLRVSEVVTLKATDVDGPRMLIRVEQGKGGKDRHATLIHRWSWSTIMALVEAVSRYGDLERARQPPTGRKR